MIKVDGGFGAMSTSLVFEQGDLVSRSCKSESKNEGKCLSVYSKSSEEGKRVDNGSASNGFIDGRWDDEGQMMFCCWWIDDGS